MNAAIDGKLACRLMGYNCGSLVVEEEVVVKTSMSSFTSNDAKFGDEYLDGLIILVID
jgi:hypothetical protein